MGWGSGSYVANGVWDAVKGRLKPEEVAEAAQGIIDALRDNDWDTLEEAPDLLEAAGWVYDDEEGWLTPDEQDELS